MTGFTNWPHSQTATSKQRWHLNKLGNHSYLLQTEEGQTYRINRKFIRTSQSSLDIPSNQADSPSAEANGPSAEVKGPLAEIDAPSERTSASVGTEIECEAVQDNTSTPETVTSTPKVTLRGRVVKLPEKLKDCVRL